MKNYINKKLKTIPFFNGIIIILLLFTTYGLFHELSYFHNPISTTGKVARAIPQAELVTERVTRHYWLAAITFSSKDGKIYQFISNQDYRQKPIEGTPIAVTYDANNPNHARISSSTSQYPTFILAIFIELALLGVLSLGLIQKIIL